MKIIQMNFITNQENQKLPSNPTNPAINAQEFVRKMKKTIPVSKFYTTISFPNRNAIFFQANVKEKVNFVVYEDVAYTVYSVRWGTFFSSKPS